ncbi:MAG: TonB-dependent receptor domain-containing protein, partial [Flavitalea sp.]
MRIPLLAFALLCFLHIQLFSQQNDSRFNLDLNNVSFDEFVIKMEQQSKVHFFYDEQLLAGFRVSITVSNRAAPEILRAVFRNTDFRYAMDNDGNIFITRRTAILTRPAWDALPEDSLNYADETIATDNRIYTIGIKTNVAPKGKAIITGIIKDAVTGLPIPNARINADKDQRGITSNAGGRFSIELNKGLHELTISADNKTPLKRKIDLYNDGSISFQLKDEIKVLSEVIITARRNSIVNRPQMGIERLNLRAIKQIPAAFGEADVLKAILTLPGVKTVGEASAGFNVRGGASDQNLILFNDATIYNPTHFFGLFSSFNPELIKDVELYKSSIPVKYGGRLSSVLNVTGKEGDKKKITGSAGIGLLTSRLNIEGPLVKDKTSFTLGGRTTYSNWLLKMIPDKSEFDNSKASFYDINAGVHHIIDKNNEVQFSGYYSKDDFNLNSDTTFGYSNLNMTLKWRHTFSSKMNADFVAGYDRYSYFNSSDEVPTNAYKMAFDINQLHAKADFNYYVGPLHAVEFGASTILYKIHPGNFTPEGDLSIVQEKIIREEQALETSLYFGNKYDLSDRLSVQSGIRYNIFSFLGPNSVNYYTQGIPRDETSFIESKEFGSGKFIKTYHGPEFRASMRYSLQDDLSIKASVNTTRQNIHMLSNTTAISPTDIWKLSDPNIRPQQGSQFSVGIYKNVFSDSIEISVEGYYKR